jgi:hypothetical protein
MIAEPIIEALVAPHSIANGDKVYVYKIFHNGKEHTYWMWWSEYEKMLEYEKELNNRLYKAWIGS